jgi:hypothetical protein
VLIPTCPGGRSCQGGMAWPTRLLLLSLFLFLLLRLLLLLLLPVLLLQQELPAQSLVLWGPGTRIGSPDRCCLQGTKTGTMDASGRTKQQAKTAS